MVGNVGQVQIRHYSAHLVASVAVPGSEITARSAGFRRLARYIFGANSANTEISMTAPVVQSAKIAMTAPVAQRRNTAGEWVISFYMPAKYTRANLPKPEDPGIEIHELPGVNMAVVQFSGVPGVALVEKAQATLLRALAGSGWEITGAPVTWFYDPPWTLPWARRNEVAVPVQARPP